VLAKHHGQAGIALGHVMAKLLRIALAVWKSGKPFDSEHYNWRNAAHLPASRDQGRERRDAEEGPASPASPASRSSSLVAPREENAQAAGHKDPALPERKVVTAAQRITTVANKALTTGALVSAPSDMPMSLNKRRPSGGAGRVWVDFAHVKSQLSLERVLEHLGLAASFKGRGRQRRGPCPVHDRDGKTKGRTFAVQLDHNAFYCFYPPCGIKGDVLDLWARLKGLKLRDAAIDLVNVFNLEAAPGTEKRNG
jgi:hypothetical protein